MSELASQRHGVKSARVEGLLVRPIFGARITGIITTCHQSAVFSRCMSLNLEDPLGRNPFNDITGFAKSLDLVVIYSLKGFMYIEDRA